MKRDLTKAQGPSGGTTKRNGPSIIWCAPWYGCIQFGWLEAVRKSQRALAIPMDAYGSDGWRALD